MGKYDLNSTARPKQLSRRHRFASILAVMLSVSCTTTSYQVAGYSQRYGSEFFAPTEDVSVYLRGSPPSLPYRRIGTIEIAGGPNTLSGELTHEAMRRARAMGAHALIEVDIRKATPAYVKNNTKREVSAGKTIGAVLLGALVVGVVAVAIVAASNSDDGDGDGDGDDSDDDDDSIHRSHSHYSSDDDNSSSSTTSRLRVPVLRAQAIRFQSEDAGASSDKVLSSLSVREWVGKKLLAHRSKLISCLVYADSSPSTVKLVMDLEVSEKGQPLLVEIDQSTATDERFGDCVRATVEGLSFGSTPNLRPVSIQLPMRFNTKDLIGRKKPLPPPAPIIPPRKILMLDLNAPVPEDISLARAASDLAAQAFMADRKLTVQTLADVEARLRLEQYKDALGCSDVACAAEIAGALGVELIFYGSATVVGSERAFSGSVITQSGKVIARRVVISALNAPLEPAIETLVRELRLEIANSLK